MTAPVASGWSISPGGAFTHWKSAAFARRTPVGDSHEKWQQTFAANPESKKLTFAVMAEYLNRAAHVLLAAIGAALRLLGENRMSFNGIGERVRQLVVKV